MNESRVREILREMNFDDLYALKSTCTNVEVMRYVEEELSRRYYVGASELGDRLGKFITGQFGV